MINLGTQTIEASRLKLRRFREDDGNSMFHNRCNALNSKVHV